MGPEIDETPTFLLSMFVYIGDIPVVVSWSGPSTVGKRGIALYGFWIMRGWVINGRLQAYG